MPSAAARNITARRPPTTIFHLQAATLLEIRHKKSFYGFSFSVMRILLKLPTPGQAANRDGSEIFHGSIFHPAFFCHFSAEAYYKLFLLKLRDYPEFAEFIDVPNKDIAMAGVRFLAKRVNYLTWSSFNDKRLVGKRKPETVFLKRRAEITEQIPATALVKKNLKFVCHLYPYPEIKLFD